MTKSKKAPLRRLLERTEADPFRLRTHLGALFGNRSLGAEIILDARTPDAAEQIVKSGGAQGVLATAVSTPAFAQGLAHRASQGHGKPQAVRRFPDADLRCRLKRITIRGSIAGNRKTLAEALEFVAEG